MLLQALLLPLFSWYMINLVNALPHGLRNEMDTVTVDDSIDNKMRNEKNVNNQRMVNVFAYQFPHEHHFSGDKPDSYLNLDAPISIDSLASSIYNTAFEEEIAKFDSYKMKENEKNGENVYRTEFPETKYLEDKANTGIAVSGGGSRSFSATMGYFRGLYDLGLMNDTRYISSVSGGSWATAAYTFHNMDIDGTGDGVGTEQFLGKIVPPEEITVPYLMKIVPHCARFFPVVKDFLRYAALLLVAGVRPSDVWIRAVYDVFLKPAGIKQTSLMSWTRETAASVIARNPSLLDRKEGIDFALPCGGGFKRKKICYNRPYPILNAAILGPVEAAPYGIRHRKYTMIESTPLYVGVPHPLNITYGQGNWHILLGGVVEPLGYGSPVDTSFRGLAYVNKTSSIIRIPEPQYLYTIANATGYGSWAPGAPVAEESILKRLSNILIQTSYFSPTFGGASKKIYVGDGASTENQGVISLLRREVDRLVVFINAPTPVKPRSQFHPFLRPVVPDSDLDGSFCALFGVLSLAPSFGADFTRDKVFPRVDFPYIASKLQEAKEKGNGIVVTARLPVIENKWWGIKGGRIVTVTFVYLDRAYQWENKLTNATATYLAPSPDAKSNQTPINRDKDGRLIYDGKFKGFPNLGTMQIHLSPEQANLMGDLAGWVIKKNEQVFRKALGKYPEFNVKDESHIDYVSQLLQKKEKKNDNKKAQGKIGIEIM